MKRGGWIALGVGGVLAVAAAAGYWFATGGVDHGRLTPAWLTSRPIAHRGLHTGPFMQPENSLAALQSAADNGYAIELDVLLEQDSAPYWSGGPGIQVSESSLLFIAQSRK